MECDESPSIYGMEFQARALCPVYTADESIRFLVGTQSLRTENQLHLLTYDEETRRIARSVLAHPEGELWQLTAFAADPRLFASVYTELNATRTEARRAARLWRLPQDACESAPMPGSAGGSPERGGGSPDAAASLQPVEPLCDLPTREFGDVRAILTHPSERVSDQVIALVDARILPLRLDASGAAVRTEESSLGVLEGRGQPKFTTGRWNPHHGSAQIATAHDGAVRGWDLRSMKCCFAMESAHMQMVRSLDYNPNRPYMLASCGDDCRTKFWDTRSPGEPVKVVQEHSHWVWSVRYNPNRDQLVLTSGSDARVCLLSAVSVCSEPDGDEEEDEEDEDIRRHREKPEDGVVRMYEEHEESVYAAEWSVVDHWIFASLSFDGRLVINHVPKKEKFKIIL